DLRHRHRADARADPPHRLRECEAQGRRDLAAHHRPGARRLDPWHSGPRQARHPHCHDRQGLRHEGHRLEPEPHAQKCKEAGVDYVSKEDLFRQADFISIHVVLSQRSRGLVGAKEFALMKPTAYLINTSRGPIVDEAAMLAVLRDKKIAGAGLDVFDVEPLPKDHPLRKMDNVVLTPHLGYVALKNYQNYFAGVVEDIRGFIDGKPVRVMTN